MSSGVGVAGETVYPTADRALASLYQAVEAQTARIEELRREVEALRECLPVPPFEMTVDQVVAVFGISRSLVYRLVREGVLPCSRRAGKRGVLLRRSDVEAWRRGQ